MANVNGFGGAWSNIYSNDYSYLFSSTTNNNKSTTSNLLGIDFAEYSSITRGSYSKLIKAYYEKYGDDSKKLSSLDDKESVVTKTSLKTSADALYEAASALVTNGKNSVFKQVEITDEESGAKSKGYDKDKIFDAVKTMVDAYNSMVKDSTDSDSNAVLRQTLHMINSVSANGSLLSDVGIKIGEDNQLSIDEEAFKKADMGTVKTLFNGSSSLGGKIQAAASGIYLNVNNSLGNDNFYTASGMLGKYSTGNILDSFL